MLESRSLFSIQLLEATLLAENGFASRLSRFMNNKKP